MTAVSASAVSSLRSRTGVSILACKQALEEAGGDEEKAIELLRKRGIAQAAKKAERDQSEGCIFVAESKGKAALVFLRCETDFVARDDTFQELGRSLATALAEHGKAAMEKLAGERVPEMVQRLGENISIGEAVLAEGGTVGTYVHGNAKIGVVVVLDSGTVEQARDVAMHAAAMNPRYVRPEEVPSNDLEMERGIWKEQLAKEGKPEQIMEKIMLGKEKKFREENALVTQPFVKDANQTIQQYLGKATITMYNRISVK